MKMKQQLSQYFKEIYMFYVYTYILYMNNNYSCEYTSFREQEKYSKLFMYCNYLPQRKTIF